jgi:hypothetical protein
MRSARISVERCLGLVHTATPSFHHDHPEAQLICAMPITSSLEPVFADASFLLPSIV